MTDWTEDAEQQGWEDELELHLATRKPLPEPSEEDVEFWRDDPLDIQW